jgi:hypothetical protein
MNEIPLVHTLRSLQVTIQSLGTVRESPEKLERVIHLFECLWHWLLYTSLIENLTVPQRSQPGAFDGLSRPSDGDYLGMLRKILKSGKELRYTQCLREFLQDKKYKQTDSQVKLIPVVQAIYQLLPIGQTTVPGSINWMEFFAVVVQFRNLRKTKKITEETAIQVIEAFEEYQL